MNAKLVWTIIPEAMRMNPRDLYLDRMMRKAETRIDDVEWYDDSWNTIPPPNKPELYCLSED